jgi:hypothetical protein
MTDELRVKLEKAAEHIITTSAKETATGTYYFHPEEIPADIISEDLFIKYQETIMEIMFKYDSVADVEIDPDGTMNTMMFTDYCPNYLPHPEEADEYLPDREIFDPIASRHKSKNDQTLPLPVKLTLGARLEAAKIKAAQQDIPDKIKKTTRLEI